MKKGSFGSLEKTMSYEPALPFELVSYSLFYSEMKSYINVIKPGKKINYQLEIILRDFL